MIRQDIISQFSAYISPKLFIYNTFPKAIVMYIMVMYLLKFLGEISLGKYPMLAET